MAKKVARLMIVIVLIVAALSAANSVSAENVLSTSCVTLRGVRVLTSTDDWADLTRTRICAGQMTIWVEVWAPGSFNLTASSEVGVLVRNQNGVVETELSGKKLSFVGAGEKYLATVFITIEEGATFSLATAEGDIVAQGNITLTDQMTNVQIWEPGFTGDWAFEALKDLGSETAPDAVVSYAGIGTPENPGNVNALSDPADFGGDQLRDPFWVEETDWAEGGWLHFSALFPR